MKKRVIGICIIGTILLIVGICTFYSPNKNTFTQDGVTYALTLDGASINSFPAKGMYRVDVECSNAIGKWLYDEWKLVIEDFTSNNITCDIDFTTISQTNLNTYVTSLAGQTQGNGQVVNENGYRYEGKNPNNYIWFNNELWRIIGVFDENSHGQIGENLVKIIRNESIGGLAWDSGNVNDWSAASLKALLNENYYNATDGTDSGNCYGYSTNLQTNCDYTIIGINSAYRPMVKNVTWYLGGYSSDSATADDFYGYERGTTVYEGNSTSTTGYIGLMYVSDYGYSALASSCARTINLGSYNNSKCAGESWLYGQGAGRPITPRSSYTDYVFIFSDGGNLSYSGAKYGYAARPVLYLDSSVYVVDGSGSISDPYIIGM